MKRLSGAVAADFEMLFTSIKRLNGFDTVEGVAQAFVDTIYEQFQESLVLLRLFSSLPYSTLPPRDKELVNSKAESSGTAALYKDSTPVLTLLGTRGQQPEWNVRSQSSGFRCIPLVSSGYVGSLSMLSMQLKMMNFDLALLDNLDAWQAEQRADRYTGTLYVADAATDKDDKGRMVVPRQDFVAENGVKTALGFGAGYRNHLTIVTLFAFANETIPRSAVEPFSALLQTYLSLSEHLLVQGKIFS